MIPPDYKCKDCDMQGVKLWRGYQSIPIELRCGACTSKHENRTLDLAESDQCAWSVPAIPDLQGAYWGYTSVPAEGVAWWKALPLKLEGEWRDKNDTYRWYPYRIGMDLWLQESKNSEPVRIDTREMKVLLRFKS